MKSPRPANTISRDCSSGLKYAIESVGAKRVVLVFRLDEAIGNVFSNAIKYGAGKPVTVDLKAKDGKATLVVQDRGIGVPMEDLSRVFGRFERTSISHNYGGLGLGLYIAKQVIEQHEGSIRAENRSGGGARIVIELPPTANSD